MPANAHNNAARKVQPKAEKIRSTHSENPNKYEIAIIGMSCRFPDAADYNVFWDNLKNEVNSIKNISKKRWDTGKHCCMDASEPDTGICGYNGMLEDFDRFDGGFFNISPREANNMDPQQRLLLEETWHCIEDSGIPLCKLRQKKTSVYAGVTGNDYNLVTLVTDKDIDSYASLGSFECMISNRVSHAFGFNGISFTLDAACASSLVALHEAKKTLIHGESDFAFAAGVCVAFHPWRYITFSKSRMMSPDGQCKTFDKDANGFVQGEGVAVLLLQRLEDAIADGSHIYGVIKGSAVNHCGHSLTIAAPSVKAQKEVILSAFEDAQISPDTVSYIEAHGTGTSLGDPIEVEALTQAFRQYTSKKQFCNIGSVKTNIGHLASAAGIAGVVKILLMMKNRQIPKLLNLNTLNPIIDFENSPFTVPEEHIDWKSPKKNTPLRAGVSAFGFGGVNAHIVLEEWKGKVNSKTDNSKPNQEKERIFVLSAKTSESIEDNKKVWAKFIDDDNIKGFDLGDICSTLLTGRQPFEFRCGKVVTCVDEIRSFLDENNNINAIFTGEWCLGLGELSGVNSAFIRELAGYNVFRHKLNEALQCLKKVDAESHAARYFENITGNMPDSKVHKFIFGYMLASGILELGFKPSVLACEKSGLWIGLVISGMASLEDIIRVLAGKSEAHKLKLTNPDIPFYDAVEKTVIKPYKFDKTYFEALFDGLALRKEALEYYINKARLLFSTQFTFKKNIEDWKVAFTKYGYNTPEMIYDDRFLQSGQDEFIKEKLILMAAIVSSLLRLNKKWDLSDHHNNIKDERFNEALNLLLDKVLTEEMYLDIVLGDNANLDDILNNLDLRQANLNPANSYTYLKKTRKTPIEQDKVGKWLEQYLNIEPSSCTGIGGGACLDLGKLGIQSDRDIKASMYEGSGLSFKKCLLDLWLNGVDLHWEELYPDGSFKKLPLPVYSFKGEVYWLPLDEKKRFKALSLHPMIDINESTLVEEKFKKVLKIEEFYVKDHVVDRKVILPGVAYLEMARAAGQLAAGKAVKAIKDVVWVKPIVMETEQRDVYIGLYPSQNFVAYEVYSMSMDKKTVHSQGKLLYDGDCSFSEPCTFDIDSIKQRCGFTIGKHECYESVFSQNIGFDYGPAFQLTQQAFGGEHESFEVLSLPEHLKDSFDDFVLHPSIIDAALRAITWIGGKDAHKKLALHIPFALGELEILGKLPRECYSYATIVEETIGKSSGSRRFNISILDSHGTELVRIRDFTIRELKSELSSTAKEENSLNCYGIRYIQSPINEKVLIEKPNSDGRVLLFDDNKDRREALAKHIKDMSGCDTVFVAGGAGFEKVDGTLYHINGTDEQSYRKLVNELGKDGTVISHILHMWNMDAQPFDTTANDIDKVFGQLAASLDTGLYSLMYIFKALTLLKPDYKVKCLFGYFSGSSGTAPQFEMISSFAKSVLAANHKFEFASFSMDEKSCDFKALSEVIVRELGNGKKSSGSDIRYIDGERYVKTVYPADINQKTGVQIKQGGVYIITGGVGGVGMLTAQYLAGNYKAKLVLTGRTQPDVQKLGKIEALKELGSEVMFESCDVSSMEAVKSLIAAAKQCFGKIDGIIHCAGITDEVPVMQANKEVYEKVLAPKIYGTVNLDMACEHEDLDFFIMFSSIAAVVGDYGRGSYSAANRFMDGYAAYREELSARGMRKGQSLSINWPLWQDGGMQVKGDEAAVYFEYSGMAALDTDRAFKTLENALASGSTQVVVTFGDARKINRVLDVYSGTHETQESGTLVELKPENTMSGSAELHKAAEDYLKGILSKTTNMPAEKIDSKAALERYGIDSIMILELNKLLENDFESLPRTLFFEYGNIFDLANYFVQNHHEKLRKMVSYNAPDNSPDSIGSTAKEYTDSKVPGYSQMQNRFAAYAKNDVQNESQYGSKYESKYETHIETDKGKSIKDDIAIIGLSGKYPMANTLDEFWENLKNGRDCITEVPLDRWNHSKYYDSEKGKSGKVYSKWGGFIDDVDKFDALFFQISPKEAQVIDPQERLFLEAVYHAVEDAGYTRYSLGTNSVGVFVGIMNGHYQLFGAEELMKGNMMDIRSSYASIANRVSYFFNFSGPSIGLDTMCSSSLTAIHLACQSILSGETDMAVAGGVNVTIHPAKYVFLSEQKFGSSEGKCRAFGEGGDGYVPSEGVGAILLKPLSKAIADNDNIYGVIKASTINHGGKTNGYTVPNPSAQGSLILDALKKADINPCTISYLEAHGTGTKLGDPIEIAGLSKAFREYTVKKQFCAIGSVKANIGHAEAAAGIASLTKVLLQMKNKTIVPSIHADVLNNNIDFNNSPFYVQTSVKEWENTLIEENGKTTICPRRAGISSFGAGGTNVHLIVEEYTRHEEPLKSSDTAQLIVLSAKNPERLKAYASKMLEFLRNELGMKAVASGSLNSCVKKLEKDILTAAARVLGMDENHIKTNESLYEYGMKPMELAQLSQDIQQMLNTEITPAVLAEHETIQSLAQWLGMSFKKQVEGKFNANVEEQQQEPGISLEDMAYTLQTGREAMESRLGIIVSSVFELVEKLDGFCRDEQHTDRVYSGNTGTSKSITYPGSNEMMQYEQDFMAGRQLDKIAQLWVSGVDFDWNKIYGERKRRKIKLPSYPFRRDRYWVPVNPGSKVEGIMGWHPLIDGVEPRLSVGDGLVYTKRLLSCESILDHHKVQGRAVFPGVAHIETAYAAAKQIADNISHITGITWLRPLAVDGQKDIHIALTRNKSLSGGKSSINYEIKGQEGQDTVVYSTGCFVEQAPGRRSEQHIELESIKGRCGRYVDKDEVYLAFCQAGLDYGLHFRGIESLHIGRGEVLASIRIPEQYENGLNTYTLHPTAMDAALQAISGIAGYIGTGSRNTMMPYAIESLEILNSLGITSYAYVKQVSQGLFDVVLTDESGLVCVRMNGVSVRQSRDLYEDFFYMPVWKKIESTGSMTQGSMAQPNGRNVLLVYNNQASDIAREFLNLHNRDNVMEVELGNFIRKLSERVIEADIRNPGCFAQIMDWLIEPDLVYFLGGIERGGMEPDNLQALEESQKKGVLSFFRMVKAFIGMGWDNKPLEIKVITNDVYSITADEHIRPYAASLHGFANSLAREQIQWNVVCMDISMGGKQAGSMEMAKADMTQAAMAQIAQSIYNEKGSQRGKEIALRRGERYIRVVHPVILPSQHESQFRHQGVYMIIGGAGGIGLELCTYLAEKYSARLVLVGRSELKNQQKDKITAIQAKGGKVMYIQADATDEESIRKSIDLVKAEFGNINGVIHSAIVLKDVTIKNMDEETLKAALNPKVMGSAALAKAFLGYPLEFMMFFSSAQSISCNPGQSNYAAACTFKDAYALYLAQTRPYDVKVVNWGFWGSVGVVANDEYNKLLAQRGIYSIKPSDGMEAVERILANPVRQIMPIRADRRQMESMSADFGRQIEIYRDLEAEKLRVPYEAMQPLMEDADMQRHRAAFEEMEKLGELLLVDALVNAGIFSRTGVEYSKNELAAILKIVPLYEGLFEALLIVLDKAGYIKYSDGRIAVNYIAPFNLEALREKLISEYPEISANINLMWICMKNYGDILSGKVPATDIMFPNSSMELVQGIYRGNKLADHFNNLVTWSLMTYIEQKLRVLQHGRKLKIVEIGAGTGGTSKGVFDTIRKYGDRLEYYYTDISAGFTKYGQEKFGAENPYVKFTVLNIENDITSQGFEVGAYDAVIATNVLHATRSIGNTLANIKNLLKAGGVVIINEATAFSEFLTFTFGLLAGWWLYVDKQARIPHSPLLSPDMWKSELLQKGFGHVAVLGKTSSGIDIPTQDVIVAQSDGVIIKASDGKWKIPVHEKVMEYSDTNAANSPLAQTPGTAAKALPLHQAALAEKNLPGKVDEDTLADYIRQKIMDSLTKALGINKYDIDTSKQFSEYGVDSITGVELIKNINEALQVSLRTTALFDYANVKELTGFVHKSFGNEISSMVQTAPGHRPETVIDSSDSTQYDIKGSIEEKIIGSIVKALGVNRQDISFDRQFSEYGVDSITGLELIKNINQVLGITLRATVLFDYGNISKLTDYIYTQHGEGIKSLAPERSTKTSPDGTAANSELEALRKLAKGELSLEEVFGIMEESYGEL